MQTPTGIAGKMAVGEFEWKTGTGGLHFACWVVVALLDWISREMHWRETLPGGGLALPAVWSASSEWREQKLSLNAQGHSLDHLCVVDWGLVVVVVAFEDRRGVDFAPLRFAS
jgi:hypothetical protein